MEGIQAPLDHEAICRPLRSLQDQVERQLLRGPPPSQVRPAPPSETDSAPTPAPAPAPAPVPTRRRAEIGYDYEAAAKVSVECALCKKASGISKDHRHFSSVEVRLNAKGRYYCESCKGEHRPTDIGPRHKLHITSSTLHKYWANTSARGDSRHVDHVSVCGGTIPDLHRACEWELDRLSDRPVDVVLSGGTLNSVAKGFTVTAIKDQLERFQAMVLKKNERNTFVVATVPFAPKFCIFQPSFENRDGSNKLGLLTKINQLIVTKWTDVPRLHVLGLSEQASLPPLGGSAGRFLDTAKGKLNAVDPDAWREKELKNKLHLSNAVQQKAALAVMKYLDCEKLKELEKRSQNCLFLAENY